jgi:hypothetical protein
MSIFKDESPYSVLVGDSKIIDENEVLDWCRNTEGFQGVITTDVSDVSATDDIIYTYLFDTQEAATWFKLRWL